MDQHLKKGCGLLDTTLALLQLTGIPGPWLDTTSQKSILQYVADSAQNGILFTIRRTLAVVDRHIPPGSRPKGSFDVFISPGSLLDTETRACTCLFLADKRLP